MKPLLLYSSFTSLFLFGLCTSTSSQDLPPIEITVNAEIQLTDLKPIWNYFGYDEALTTLTNEGQHLLNELKKMSAPEDIHIRVHHLLTSSDSLALKWSGTNVYSEDESGNPMYNWTIMDQLMDALSVSGLKPFVQASFMPKDLSSHPNDYTPTLTYRGMPKNMVSGGAFYPPKDYKKWEKLIENWAQHSADRYGKEQASSWLWEPWNEPESEYWRGTNEEFFKLYDHFAAGVKKVLPTAKVGGPHVTDPGWRDGDAFLKSFLDHCQGGTNHNIKKEVPLDFIAFHAKGNTKVNEDGKVEMKISNQLSTIQTYSEIISSYPRYSDLPIYIGESDPEGCAGCPATHSPERQYRLTSQFAAYTAAAFMRKQDLMAKYGLSLEGAVSWAFTFHDQPWFNGLRALTTNEIALPVFNAFKLFSRLGSQRIHVLNPTALTTQDIINDGVRGDRGDVNALATKTDKQIQILVWHYHDIEGHDPIEPVKIKCKGLPIAQDIMIKETRVDHVNNNAHTAWLEMGSPQSPSPQQIKTLEDVAMLKSESHGSQISNNGAINIEINMPRQSVSLITLEWE